MPLTRSLLTTVKGDYPDIQFVDADDFVWSATDQSIHYDVTSPSADQDLIHELAHALLHHATYNRDIELVGMERDAWQLAAETLGPRYHVPITSQIVDEALDSYRSWLHDRSTCPQCEATGLEMSKVHYTCPACNHSWKVNEARTCGLKRYSIK